MSFQEPQGADIVRRLASKCDILVENYLPSKLRKYGLDYATMRGINPGLIYASITGYGQTGPYSSRAGYDVMVEAEFGLMHITGEPDATPVKVGVAITECVMCLPFGKLGSEAYGMYSLTTGLYTQSAILAALLSRAQTGKGTWIDASLMESQVSLFLPTFWR